MVRPLYSRGRFAGWSNTQGVRAQKLSRRLKTLPRSVNCYSLNGGQDLSAMRVKQRGSLRHMGLADSLAPRIRLRPLTLPHLQTAYGATSRLSTAELFPH